MTGWEVSAMVEAEAMRQWEDMQIPEEEGDAYDSANSSVSEAISNFDSADELLSDAALQMYNVSQVLYDKITSIRSDLYTLIKAVCEINSKLERRESA